MANRERGEYRLVAGERTYTLRLTTNACCELEDFSGREFDQIIKGANKGSVKDVRLILWAALREYHPDVALDSAHGLKAIGQVIDACGGLVGILTQIQAFLSLNADTADETNGGAANAGTRPLGAQDDGIGANTPLTH